MYPTLKILKKLTKQKGISLNELENQLGYSKNSLYSLKNQNASIERIHELADYFNVSIDYLLGRTDIPTINTGTILGDNNTINGNFSSDVSGNITINNTTNNPVPVTLKNTDDIFESQKDDFFVQKEILRVQKEILAELKKPNKKEI